MDLSPPSWKKKPKMLWSCKNRETCTEKHRQARGAWGRALGGEEGPNTSVTQACKTERDQKSVKGESNTAIKGPEKASREVPASGQANTKLQGEGGRGRKGSVYEEHRSVAKGG